MPRKITHKQKLRKYCEENDLDPPLYKSEKIGDRGWISTVFIGGYSYNAPGVELLSTQERAENFIAKYGLHYHYHFGHIL